MSNLSPSSTVAVAVAGAGAVASTGPPATGFSASSAFCFTQSIPASSSRPFPTSASMLPSSPTTTRSSSASNTPFRSVRPRRSAASLRSIPERKSKELEPPLPVPAVPATPWIEPATPALSSDSQPRPVSPCSNPTTPDSLSPYHQHSHYMDPLHLHPNNSSPRQHRLDDHPQQQQHHQYHHPYSLPSHTVPGPRDQSSLSSYRIGSQPLTSRHSEGSQYASSSNWTPSSANGSRLEFDSSVHGMRSSVASRDSRFTAETDYDDYCNPKPSNLPNSPHHPSAPQSHSLNLSVSASWHGGDPSIRNFSGASPTPRVRTGEIIAPPTLISLIKLDQTNPNTHDVVGLGITSDETFPLHRGSRSPSITSGNDLPRPVPHPANTVKTARSARSASSSLSNPSGSTLSPFNPLHPRSNRVVTPTSERSPKPPRPNPLISSTNFPEDPYVPPSISSQDSTLNRSILSPTSATRPSLKSDPLSQSLLSFQGLPYDTSASSHIPPSNPLSMSSGTRRRPSDYSEYAHERRDHAKSKGHFADASLELKSAVSRPESHWDDFDEKSPSLSAPSQIPSQAIALVEEGRGCIVDISNSQCSLEKLEVPEDTTHLLLSKTFSPFVIGALLSSKLPIISANLVVLDISDASLNSLPSAIARCEALEELNVSGNVMTSGELPAFLSHLTSLKVLAADRCGLYHVASSYAGLSHLRDLSVRFNHLRSLPSWLCLLPRLEILLVDGNEFDPLWQELVEPLLLSNYYSRLDSQQLPSIYSSDFTDWRNLNPSSPSPNLTSFSSSNLKSLPESALAVPPTNDEPRQDVSTHRPLRGRRHLGANNNGWVASISSVVSDQLDVSDDRPQSACSAEVASPASLSHHSYLRRLRSASDMHSEVSQRSVSAHEQSCPKLDSPATSEIPQSSPDDVRDGVGHLPTHLGSRKPSLSSSTLQCSPTSYLTPLEGPNRPSNMPPHVIRSDIKHVTASEATQSPSNHVTLTPTGNQMQQNRDHQKKSFGFLKKMSLGKLRREPNRPRTASIDAMSRAFQNNIYSKPISVAGSELLPWESSNLASEGLTPKEHVLVESEGLFKKVSSGGLKSGESNPTPAATKKRSNRRSYLKLEHTISSFNPSTARVEEEDIKASPTHKEQDPYSPSGSKHPETPGLQEVDPKSSSAPSQQLLITHPLASLRSVMMYLRDVHDLSVDAVRYHGGMAANTARSVPSSSVSRATSTKHFQASSAMSAHFSTDGRSTPALPSSTGVGDLESDGLESPLSTTNMAGSSGSHEAPDVVKVTDNAPRRLKVIEEIVATEKSYIKGLKELHDIYITTASVMVSSSIGKEKEPMVPPAERKIVFNNVEAIIGFHVDVLLPDFQEVMDRLLQKQAGIATPDPKQVSGSSATDLAEKRQKVEGQLTNIAAEELARVFIRHAAFLKLYSTYITQFDSALERLREWRVTAPTTSSNASAWTPSSSNPSSSASNSHTNTLSGGQKKRLKTYMKRCRAHSSHTQMNLESYLLMPVQRLPRYKLLLENLVSCTPDLNSISMIEDESKPKQDGNQEKKPRNLSPNKIAMEALNIVGAVTAEMNERKRDSEGRQRLLYWQQRFGNKFRSPLVQPHRTLIKEGTMILMRTVKLSVKESMPSANSVAQPAPRIRVPVLHTDNQSIPIIVLLCTDLLVLVKDPGDGGRANHQSPASLFQALRLAQHSRPQVNLPATIFGVDRTIVRFVDSRAIFYFQCDSQRTAAAWMVAINQQVPLL